MAQTLRGLAAGLLVLVLLGAAAALYLWYLVAFDRSYPAGERTVVIPRGATTMEAARELARAGVIARPRLFEILAKAEHVETEVKAGEYRFPPYLTQTDVLRRVVTGGSQVALWVTIPEGFTAREIAAALAERNLGSERALDDYFLHTPLGLPDRSHSTNLEGFLYPDTYLMPIDATPSSLAKIMTDEFLQKLPRDAVARARRLHYSIPQVVTLASLVEREAKADDERRLMAGVYYNRLRRGMPLEVDATIEYTFARHKDVITRADLARRTPYNTYLNSGLPPTPIANPGAPSLAAAFDPQSSTFLFYVYKGNGHHAFSRTLEEHNANVARYLR